MITVDIYIPSVNSIRCLSLDENADIAIVIEQMRALILGEAAAPGMTDQDFFLASQHRGRILDADKTLSFYNIRSGDKLMLI